MEDETANTKGSGKMAEKYIRTGENSFIKNMWPVSNHCRKILIFNRAQAKIPSKHQLRRIEFWQLLKAGKLHLSTENKFWLPKSRKTLDAQKKFRFSMSLFSLDSKFPGVASLIGDFSIHYIEKTQIKKLFYNLKKVNDFPEI